MTLTRDISLFIDPFSHHFLGDELFNPKRNIFSGDNNLAPWIYLRNWFQQRGVQVFTADRLTRREQDNKTNVYMSFGIQQNCRALAKRGDVIASAFFAFECPVVDPQLYANLAWVQKYFKRIYTFSDATALQPFLRRPLLCQSFCIPFPFDGVNEPVWSNTDRRFLVMINGNKLPRLFLNELYTERLRAIGYFAGTGEFDLFGVGWDVPSHQPARPGTPYTLQRIYRAIVKHWQRIHPNHLLETARRVWHGPVVNKSETLGQYTYSIVFENSILKGWITEKIFDCFRSGTIPIYWGAPDIQDYIPADCFIDMREYANYDDLHQRLKSLGQGQIQKYKSTAREFFASEKFRPFTKTAFVERCAQIIEEDTGVRVS